MTQGAPAIQNKMTLVAAVPTSTPAQRRRHWEMLIISLLAIVLSFALFIRPDGRVALRGLDAHPVPETCLAKEMFHIECPGCGLTRSFICLSRGDFSASWRYNRVGWLMALACLIQVPYRTVCLSTHRSLASRPSTIFGYFLIASLILNWLLLQLFSTGAHAGV